MIIMLGAEGLLPPQLHPKQVQRCERLQHKRLLVLPIELAPGLVPASCRGSYGDKVEQEKALLDDCNIVALGAVLGFDRAHRKNIVLPEDVNRSDKRPGVRNWLTHNSK